MAASGALPEAVERVRAMGNPADSKRDMLARMSTLSDAELMTLIAAA